MLGSPAGPGGPPQRSIWSLGQAPAPTATTFTSDGFSKYGVYSLFPGGPAFGSALYSHARTIEQFTAGHLQQTTGNPFHHKADSLFSTAGYMFGAPTPPPGSPFSPVPMTQLDLFAKGFNSNIIIQQQHHQQPISGEFPTSPAKRTITESTKRCNEKCCANKTHKCECNNQDSPTRSNKFPNINNNNINEMGCSRTNPIEWSTVNVKKEPGSYNNSCQVAEITTTNNNNVISPFIKLEVTSPKNGGEITNHGGNIPVGIAVARQRYQHEVLGSPSLPPAGLLTTVNNAAAQQIKEVARLAEMDQATAGALPAASAGMAAGVTTGGVAGGGPLLHCTEDRSGALAAWPMGGAHTSALTTPTTLWQYPAPVPMEPMVPLPVPMPPVGFQLVRDPTSGSLLLLPTTAIEPLQQAVVWPSYSQPPPVLLPPLPPPPLQLLSSATSDYLSSSTTLHQHTQTHSTRLVAVTTDNNASIKRAKIPMPIPATTLIKIETDASSATSAQNKTLHHHQAVSTIATNNGTAVFTDQGMTPLVTTHVIYQHPTNLILSTPQSAPTPLSVVETLCRSQATSPVTSCLTPPPDVSPQDEMMIVQATSVQDASNQTDSPICSEDDATVVQLEPERPQEGASIGVDTSVVPESDVPAPLIVEQPEQDPEVSSQHLQLTSNVIEEFPPDLSGLELLSNSVAELEREKATDKDDLIGGGNFGGLDLLCALAEQRIREESSVDVSGIVKTKERIKKRKSKRHGSSLDEPLHKKKRRHHNASTHEKRRSSESDKAKIVECDCSFRSFKSAESEEEVRRFIASKTQNDRCCGGKGDWPCMNEMELDMRMKLADLQRQYREKQKELSKLKPKTNAKLHDSHHHHQKKRQRNKSVTLSERSVTPPIVEKTPEILKSKDVLIKPAVLTSPVRKEAKSPKLEAIKQSDRIINHYKNDLLRQAALEEQELSSSSPEKNSSSSSKKRKVGRPKKLSSPSDGSFQVTTETIVAKKPKNSFVGFLLAAKEKLKLQQNLYNNNNKTPPRFVEDSVTTHKTKKNKNNNDVIVKEVNSCKIRPKLKAEATVKSHNTEEDDDEDQNDWNSFDDDYEDEGVDEEEFDEENDELLTPSLNTDNNLEAQQQQIEVIITKENRIEDVAPPQKVNRCTLTSKHLEVDKLRVLTAMGGLFYAGHLNAVQPPDVYSITLDGERGNRPHIMSREEILRDAIVEIAPKTTNELAVGTRLCAYWSQQYRCLYPGSVAEPGTPNPARVSVEFDDGDSGSIALEDIRLLPPDYPIIEYDPNPLQSLSKRRRRTSTSISTEEKRLHQPQDPIITRPHNHKPPTPDLEVEKENKVNNANHKERKRLKKKKRDKLKQKLMLVDDQNKKKKRKHRCTDNICKHKKHHKKHRKHKKSKHHHVENGDKVCVAVVPEEQVVPITKTVIEVLDVEEQTRLKQIDDNDQEMVDCVVNPEDEVTMDDILEAAESKKSKKFRDRQESCESRSKMSAFLPARQLWSWCGKGYKRPRAKGRSRKQFYRAIQRGKETITVGDSAVFLSTGRPDRPYIGKIEAMWETCGTMVVKVKWFYHPEETVGCPLDLKYPGALFESPHVDENDVQTIAHKCEVLPLPKYTEKLGDDPERYAKIYDNNDIYYLAGYYDPTTTTLKMEPEIPFLKTD